MDITPFRIGKASDIVSSRERILYRFFEIIPGFISWLTLLLIILLSFKVPILVAIFIITFDFYWLARTLYFSFYLRSGFKRMNKHERINWLKLLETTKSKNWHDIYHLIIFSVYKEPLEIIEESFKALENTDYPKNKIIVVLAYEERNKTEAKIIAETIERKFRKSFFKFLTTWHPKDLPGEIAGKGSNLTWAAKKTKEKIIDPLTIPYKNIIFSSFDADTSVSPKYFSCLTWHYLNLKNNKASFQPIPLYINNIWQAPLISRVFSFSSTFWHTMNQERPEKLVTFSSHSMSFQVLVDVGFCQTNIVSDDSRIFWQAYLKYNGDYKTLPIFYPVSMDANVSRSFFRTMTNIYKQQKRWAYGVGEIPFLMFCFLKNKKISLKEKFFKLINLFESHWSWATNSLIIFLGGWLPLILGRGKFSQTLLSYNLPILTSRILTIAMIGIVGSIYFGMLLLPPKPPKYGKSKYLIFVIEWLLIPIIMIFFTSLPSLDAQTRLMLGKYMGFYPTEKFRK